MLHNYFRKSHRLWGNVEIYCIAEQAADENMTYAHCVIEIKGYKRTITKCNIYCFFTPTMFALKHLNVTLYLHCFSWSVGGNVLIQTLCYGAVCYNERRYNEWMAQRRVFVNNIRMVQRKRRNTIGRCSTRVHLKCRVFSLWIERQ